MRLWIRRALIAFLALLLVLVAALAWYARSSLPQTDGELRLPEAIERRLAG